MDVKFEWETFYEDDKSWHALFVVIDNLSYMAIPNFGTEDESEILNMLNDGYMPNRLDSISPWNDLP